jgi:hypothetical protein
MRNSTDLKRKLSGRWVQALCALAPCLTEAAEKAGRNVTCPVTGSKGGFRLFKDVNFTGGGCKQSLRVFPEGIDLLMWVNDWSFKKTFDELETWLGEGSVNVGRITIPIVQPKPADEKWLRDWLNSMWTGALPLSHIKAYPARAYFKRRRMFDAAMSAKDIRFHPKVKYKDEDGNDLGSFGALLLKVRNNSSQPVSLHRVYITHCGRQVSLGDLNKPKKMTPLLSKEGKGCHVRLFSPSNGFLGTSEGPETALAVYQARRFPVWPGISAAMLQTFEPPAGVHTLINFVDKDRSKTGEKTHKILEEHLTPSGIRVIDLLPPTPLLDTDVKGVDWADQLIRDPSGFDLLDHILEDELLKLA